ncbi:MAG: tRNA(Met) cytidine acetyltransferase [Pseudomonadales bacterium]|nr:tRNA(Met) cytidine acetyltransferase [Pseudomonadales bacterium]
MRWSEGDPLEDFLFDSLLLNAEIPPESNALLTDSDRVDAACFRVFEADRQQLASDEKTLRQIFAILVSAHYRTTPDDLLVLLDAPGVRLFVGEYKHCIVAAILVADEGCFDEVCVATDAVWLNRRRLKGHVLPQILAQQSHIKQALELGYWRVMRIAVVPELQARGFGTMMLASVESLLVKACSGCDFMGSSFSASAEVLSFWQQSGYEPVRCGLSRDSRSGEHAMLVLKPLSKKAESVFSLAHALFFQEFCQQLGLGLSSLESSLVEKVIGGRAFRKRSQQAQKNHQKDLPDNYQKDLLAFFAEGKRSLYACRLTAGYFLFSIAGSTRWTQLEKMQRILLIQCFLQHYDERKLVVQHGFSGKKQLLEELRKAIKHLL